MRVAGTWVVLLACSCGFASARELGAAVLRVDAAGTEALAQEVLALTQDRWLPRGWVADPRGAWLSLSARVPVGTAVEVQPVWSVEREEPPLPLQFHLNSTSPGADIPPIRATLAARMLREVPVATRRLRKGSAVSCSDVSMALREIRVAAVAEARDSCSFSAGSVALRDIGAGDIVRGNDVGQAPDVAAGMPVQLSVSSGRINVTTRAIALSDASAGDVIDVRLRGPARTLKARVVAPGSVQLADDPS